MSMGQRPYVRGLYAAVANALAAVVSPTPHTPTILDRPPGFMGIMPKKMEINRLNSTYFAPHKRNGAKECARRQRQMAAGII